MSVSFPGVIAIDKQTTSGPSCSCTVNASISITAIWNHDQGQDDTSDPAPTKVWIIETSSAAWQGATTGAQPGGGDDGTPPPPSPFNCSGSASDGVPGDQQYYKALPVGGPYTSGSVTTPAAQAPAPPAPPGWSTQSVNGKTFTLSRTLSANGTATFPTPCSVSMSCSLGSYTVLIHAQPYNYHQTSVTDNGDGTLTFTYEWLSTDGNLGDLDPSCLVHEYVTYQGSGNYFIPPAPFTIPAPGIQNPTITPSPKRQGSAGALTDNQGFRGTSHLDVAQPYQVSSFTGTQTYEFDDSATGEIDTPIPGPDSGPLSIVRTTGPRPPYIPYWWYSVTKNGTTAWTTL